MYDCAFDLQLDSDIFCIYIRILISHLGSYVEIVLPRFVYYITAIYDWVTTFVYFSSIFLALMIYHVRNSSHGNGSYL